MATVPKPKPTATFVVQREQGGVAQYHFQIVAADGKILKDMAVTGSWDDATPWHQGAYRLVSHSSSKYPNNLRLEDAGTVNTPADEGVDGGQRHAILIHQAPSSKWSQGCLVVPSQAWITDLKKSLARCGLKPEDVDFQVKGMDPYNFTVTSEKTSVVEGGSIAVTVNLDHVAPGGISKDAWIHLKVEGDATKNVDFRWTPDPTTKMTGGATGAMEGTENQLSAKDGWIKIPAGQTFVTFYIDALRDRIDEGEETLKITIDDYCFPYRDKFYRDADKVLLDDKLSISLEIRDKEKPQPPPPPPPPWNPPQNPLEPPPADPLVLDLDGNGITLVSVDSGAAYYDVDNDGFDEKTGWVGSGDALLVRDLDGNGKIEGTGELFGNATTDGFTVLRAFDANKDGKIDKSDAVWSQLKLWLDANGDGVTDPGELRTLAEFGIVQIDLNAVPSSQTVEGNTIAYTATFVRGDGSTGTVGAAYFSTHQLGAKFHVPDGFIPDAGAAELPQLKGFGNVAPTYYALSTDPGLRAAWEDFLRGCDKLDPVSLRAGMEGLLWRWAGSDGAEPGGRGPYIDARHLEAVENFFGQPFQQLDRKGHVVRTAPNKDEAADIERCYQDILDSMLTQFVSQTAKSLAAIDGDTSIAANHRFAALAHLDYDPQDGYLRGSVTDTIKALSEHADEDNSAVLKFWIDTWPVMVGVRVDFFGGDADAYRSGILQATESVTNVVEREIVMASFDRYSVVEGTSAGEGLQAFDIRPHVFLSHAGRDVMDGGIGSDLYLWERGDGDDIVRDNSTGNGRDVLGLRDVESSDATFVRDGMDLLIGIKSTGEMITVVGQFDPLRRMEAIAFSDKSFSPDEILDAINLANGSDGADVIVGSGGDDAMLADDLSPGSTSANRAGDDIYNGASGNDDYWFLRGDGDDVIDERMSTLFQSNDDALWFGDDIGPGDVEWRLSGQDLIIRIKGTNDSLTIRDEFGIANYQPGVEHFIFADGTVLEREDVRKLLMTGTDRKDAVISVDEHPSQSYLEADTIEGGRGDDVLMGSDGSDTYRFKAGDGRDVINDSGMGDAIALNKIVFGEGITAAKTHVTVLWNSVIFTFDGSQDRVAVFDQGAADRIGSYPTKLSVGSVTFADGTVWSRDDIVAKDERFDGYLEATQGGKPAPVTFYGGEYVFECSPEQGLYYLPNITHYYGTSTTLKLHGVTVADLDLQRLDMGLRFGDGSTSIIGLKDRADAGVVIEGESSVDLAVDKIVFDDGTVWSTADLQQRIVAGQSDDGNNLVQGFAGSETLAGGKGDDLMIGGNGADTYVYRRGDGFDRIDDRANFGTVGVAENDTLVLADIASDEVRLFRTGSNSAVPGNYGDLVINIDAQTVVHGDFNHDGVFDESDWGDFDGDGAIDGDTDGDGIIDVEVGEETLGQDGQIHIVGQFDDPGATVNNAIEFIRFSDGVVWTVKDVQDILLAQSQTDRDDVVRGFHRDETLEGGLGNDTLSGGLGSDTYIWSSGDGRDRILDGGSLFQGLDFGGYWEAHGNDLDVLRLKNVRPDDVTVTRSLADPDTLEIIVGGTRQQSIVLTNQTGVNSTDVIERVVFDDGTVWDASDLVLKAEGPVPAAPTVTGTGVSETLDGSDHRDVIDGGEGDDLLRGGQGSDVYLWGKGSGNDVIEELGYQSWRDADIVKLRGLMPGDIEVSPVASWRGVDMVVTIKETGETLTVLSQYSLASRRNYPGADGTADYGGAYGVEKIVFADGTVWTTKDMLEHAVLQGTNGNDSIAGTILGLNPIPIVGGKGDDTLAGTRLSDEFIWRRGDGNDRIEDPTTGTTPQDVLVMHGVNASDIQLTRHADGTVVVVDGVSGETISLVGQANGAGIEKIAFDDGTVWTRSSIDYAPQEATDGPDFISGSGTAEMLEGKRGDDTIYGNGGSDTFLWKTGDGNDVLDASAASDQETPRLVLKDVLPGGIVLSRAAPLWSQGGSPVPNWDLLVTVLATGEVIRIEMQFGNSFPGFRPGMDAIVFSDGSSLTRGEIEALAPHVNTPPLALDDESVGSIGTDGSVRIAVDGLLGNDIDIDGALTVTAAFGGSGGSARLEDGFVRFVPDAPGPATFRYEVQDQDGATAQAEAALFIAPVATAGDVFGSDYNDQISGSRYSDGIVAGFGDDTVNAGSGDDIVSGGDGADVIDGGAGNDWILGGFGSDTILGGTGDDHIWAGGHGPEAGALGDLVKAGAGNDTVFGSDGADSVYGSYGDDWIAGGHGDDMLRGDDGNDTVSGDEGADLILGLDGNDQLSGDSGDDRIYGGLGDDTISGGDGNDLAYGDAGRDILTGGLGNDRLFGGDGNDALQGGDGADLLYGDKGDDSISGGDGNDRIWGGEGNDSIDAGEGANVVLAGTGDDTVSGGSGRDRLSGDEGNDRLSGNAGNDTLEGGAGDDSLWGGDGADVILGGDGADLIVGGAGSDKLTGGLGADSFVFDARVFGKDIVTDFDDGDVISFTPETFKDYGAVAAAMQQVGDNVVITLNWGSQITVEHTRKADLTADHFSFG